MTDIHHIGIRVSDLGQAIQVLERAFSVEALHDVQSPGSELRIAYIKFGNCHLELVQDPNKPLGSGQSAIDHIAVRSNDIERDMAELSRRGFSSSDVVPRGAAFGNLVAAYDAADFSGIKLHLVEETKGNPL